MKKLFTLFALTILSTLSYAATDREIVKEFEFMGYDLRLVVPGTEWTSVTNKAFTVSIVPKAADAPYHMSETMGDLFRKNDDDSYTKVPSGTVLTAGIYHYRNQIRIDGTNGSSYTIPEKENASSVVVKVNGQKWKVDYTYATRQDTYSYFHVESPDFKLIDNAINDYSLWQELWFTEAVDKADMNGKVFKAYGDTVMVSVIDPDNKMSIDANTARFGTPTDSASYNFRLKTGGTSTETKTLLKIFVPSAGQLRLAVRTGRNGESRSLAISQGGVTIYDSNVSEDDSINVDGKKYYPYIYVNIQAGDLYISSPSNGIYIYEIAFREEARYGTDFQFEKASYSFGEDGFCFSAYEENANAAAMADGVMLLIKSPELLGEFNTHHLSDPRQIIRSVMQVDGQSLTIIAAQVQISAISSEMVSLWAKVLCQDFKIYTVNAVAQKTPEGIMEVQKDDAPCAKVLRDGQLYIIRGDKLYNVQGMEVKP